MVNLTGLTSDQQQALKQLNEWYKSPSLIMTLEGYAGTGKTYILNKFIKDIVVHSCCVTAPTHKAVRIVENAVGKKGRTLQSLHGLRPDFNLEGFNIGSIKFDSLADPAIKNFKIVIIDEASMINSSLYELNEIRARQYNCKILYVGDSYQLPPVKESISKVFTGANKVTLNTIVRQDKNNPIHEMLSILRDDIKHGTAKFINYIVNNKEAINDKGEGFKVLRSSEFNKELIDVFSSKEFEKDLDYVRYTAWTNDSINKFNTYIRTKIIPDNKAIVSVDDLFTGYKTIVNDYNTPIILNSEDYIVENVEERISDFGFNCFRTTLRSAYTFMPTSVDIVNHKDESFVNYYKKLNNLHYTAFYATATERSKRWKQYFEFKDRFLTLVKFNLKDSGSDESRGRVDKDIDYGYGLTTHKCQGSTYKNIFVNVDDIAFYKDNKGKLSLRKDYGKNTDITDLRNKLLYVAISRVSKKAVLLLNI